MLVKEIDAERDKIYKSIEDRKLYDAFKQIEVLLDLGACLPLKSKLDSIKTTYSYMTQYLVQGVEDPQRDKVYASVIESLYEITDLLIDEIKINEASDYVYDKRRYYNSKGGADIRKSISLLVAEQDKYQLLKEAEVVDSVLLDSIKIIENIQEDIFGIIASLLNFTDEDNKAIKQLLNDKKFGVVTSSLVVSAITISALSFYSEKKILILLDTYFSSDNEEIKQRALCGALLLSYIYRARVDMSEKIKRRIDLFSDDENFKNDVLQQFFQFIRTSDAEKKSNSLTREIVPDFFNFPPEIQKEINSDNILKRNITSTFKKNPYWEKMLRNSGVDKKIKELYESQYDVADAMVPLFSTLKRYPFFDKITNWLRPFNEECSDIYPLVNKYNLFTQINQLLGFLSNSDKYSMALTLLSNIEQNNLKFDKESLNSDITEILSCDDDIFESKSKTISALYIQDLYRLFNFSKFKLTNIFDLHIDLSEVAVLKPVFDNDDSLRLLGEFYLENRYYIIAQKYFMQLIKRNVFDFVLYQKLGFCKQKIEDYEGAIEEYVKADQISEDYWTYCSLAQCYREMGNISKAIEYYKDALKLEPDATELDQYIGDCLVEKGKYEEALKHFYKVDYITGGSPMLWQQISWCSLNLKKFESAEKYYKKVLSSKPSFVDYINMGHIYLSQKKIKNACEYYKKSMELNENSKDFFYNTFSNKYKTLLKLGVSKNDMAIIRDIFSQGKTP